MSSFRVPGQQDTVDAMRNVGGLVIATHPYMQQFQHNASRIPGVDFRPKAVQCPGNIDFQAIDIDRT